MPLQREFPSSSSSSSLRRVSRAADVIPSPIQPNSKIEFLFNGARSLRKFRATMELRIRTYIHIHRVTGVRPTNHRAKLSTARERERERGVEADRVTSRIDAILAAIHTIPPAGTLPGIVSTDNTLTDDLPFTRALFTASPRDDEIYLFCQRIDKS